MIFSLYSIGDEVPFIFIASRNFRLPTNEGYVYVCMLYDYINVLCITEKELKVSFCLVNFLLTHKQEHSLMVTL